MKLVLLSTLLVLLTACGASARPSQDDIRDALKAGYSGFGVLPKGASNDAIACMAETLHDSALSDEALRAIVDGDDDYDVSNEDDEAMTGLQDEIAECISG